MNRPVELSASLMCIDWLRAADQLRALELAGIDFLHYDVIDGLFAPDFTMGSSIINKFREETSLRSDYHLMAEEPSRLFESFEFGPGDFFTIHQESARNLHRDLVKIRQLGAQVGVALSPATPLETLEYIIEDVDMVLLMTVNPGYKGQPMVPQVLRKVKRLREIIAASNLDLIISVDGNVNARTVPDMVAAGADRLVLGSSGLFIEGKTIDEAVDEIRRAIHIGIGMRGNK
jgi:ribulose-phosphate 3-epimerase